MGSVLAVSIGMVQEKVVLLRDLELRSARRGVYVPFRFIHQSDPELFALQHSANSILPHSGVGLRATTVLTERLVTGSVRVTTSVSFGLGMVRNASVLEVTFTLTFLGADLR